MSYDFTPVSERQRLQTVGRLQPHLLGKLTFAICLEERLGRKLLISYNEFSSLKHSVRK